MLIPLEISRTLPLQRQLYDQLRELITNSRLMPGARMPSTRMMAEQFAISRITVLLTYERLTAEGYLEARPAKGTFVRKHRSNASKGATRAAAGPLDRIGFAPSSRVGEPDASLFPAGRWRALMRTGLDMLGAQVRSDPAVGTPALRVAVANWLSASRGLVVAPDQIVLLSGRQQALHLAGHLARGFGARAVVEDPCDPAAAATLAGETNGLIRIPVDEHGIRAELLPLGGVSIAHVTPEHQRPLGVTLSPARRAALLAWSAASGALILEEDCEGELRYGDMSTPSLLLMDKAERVILLGGFCTSLGPWIGLTYMVVPRRLINTATAARRLIDDGCRGLEETALAEFLDSGGYARHLHRLRKTYAARRDALLAALVRHFGAESRIWGGEAGLYLTWFPPPGLGSSRYLADMARRCGLDAVAAPADSLGMLAGGQAVLLGFGSPAPLQIEACVAAFAPSVGADRASLALSAD